MMKFRLYPVAPNRSLAGWLAFGLLTWPAGRADHSGIVTTARRRLVAGAAAALILIMPALLAPGSALSQPILNYQGRVSVAGKPVSRQGHFAFAIVDGSDSVLWTSGELPARGSTNMPRGVLQLPVVDGAYSVRLGDPSSSMPPLGSALTQRATSKLRIWFNDNEHGWDVASPDIPLAAALGAEGEANPQLEAIWRELKEIRSTLASLRSPPDQGQLPPSEPPIVTLPLGDGPRLGKADAPLVLIEFTDYQCPFCKRFQDTVLPQLIENFVEPGKLSIISRNLTLPSHPHAEPAAQAALCAERQQKFWQMREQLFVHSLNLARTNILKAAEESKLDLTEFGRCLEQKPFTAQIKKDERDAESVGIAGTPSFVLGRVVGREVTGVLIVGARPYSVFEEQIKKLLPAPK